MVSQSWRELGEVVTRQFVNSFALKHGQCSPQFSQAKRALSMLTGEHCPTSAIPAAVIRDAPVMIPNQRSSTQSRVRGRSVE
jgi:hypothetical protein